ncbi:SET domain-containing protein SmydA-8-like [Neocloeon triangulifer]|uniref:SET domain-containing protein SmydA-8-like n=1 Tax=Neocloeon triangulifer TaxID=2078957 RepID=UPI00286F7008|nr:SET domain-containing protein SmydA-8-like [Neocloeon triangulifer]
MSSEGKCAVCFIEAAQQCAGCKAVYYCGREHQKQHWGRHRFECRPVKVAEDSVQGRYLVATKNISQGDLIFTDSPLLIGPKMVCTSPVCLGCHQLAAVDCPCPGCGWPLCSLNCASAHQHKAECRVMQEKGYRAKIAGTPPITEYACIVPLRYLLMPEEKKKIVQSLQSHLDFRRKTPLYAVLRNNVVGFLTQALKLEATEDDVLGVCGVMDTNAFEIRRDGGVKLRGLYPLASMMNHDCVPNTRHVFDSEDKMLVFATVDIAKGAAVTSTYTQALWATHQRRAHLKTTKCFECQCLRCSDPSELGTYLGAILCSKCNGQGKVVSTAPLDDTAPWKCYNCEAQMTAKQVTWGNQALQKELEAMDKTGPQQLEAFLERYKAILHQTNSHALQAKLALTQIYGNTPGYLLQDLNDLQVERKLQLTHDLLDVASVLEPGRSRIRAQLQLELQAAMALQAKLDFETERITRERAEEILGDAVGLLKEATEVLKTEPDMEGKLQEKLMILMQQLELDGGVDNGGENEAIPEGPNDEHAAVQQAIDNSNEEPVIVKPRAPLRR